MCNSLWWDATDTEIILVAQEYALRYRAKHEYLPHIVSVRLDGCVDGDDRPNVARVDLINGTVKRERMRMPK